MRSIFRSRVKLALSFLFLIAAAGRCGCNLDPKIEVTLTPLTLDEGEEAVLTADISMQDIDHLTVIQWAAGDPATAEIVSPPDSLALAESVTVRGVSEGTASISVLVRGVATGSPTDTGDPETATDTATVVVGPFEGTIQGIVRDSATGPGLEGVQVRAIGAVGSPAPVFTDATGAYSIDVTKIGTYTMCAIGAIPQGGYPQRFVNTNCVDEDVDVTVASPDATYDLSIETGYYLEATDAPFDVVHAPNDSFTLDFDYRAWNRAAVPNGTTWIVVGIEGDGQDTGLGSNAGPYGSPTADASGTVSVNLTAPNSPGSYRIFARLIAVVTATDAIDTYESGFATALERNYIQIGTVTVS